MTTKIIFLALLLSFSLAAQQNPVPLDSLLLKAVKEHKLSLVKSLLEQGADVNTRDEHGASLLMWAVYRSDLPMVSYLFTKSADPTRKGIIYREKGSYGNLIGIAAHLGKIDLLKYLIENGNISVDDRALNPQSGKEDGWTALQSALYAGHTDCVEYLLKKGADSSFAFREFAIYYYHKDEYEKALPYTLQSLEYIEKTLGKNHDHYGIYLRYLSIIYRGLGRYEAALSALLEARDLAERNLGRGHAYYINSTNRLGSLYRAMGDYEKALPLLLEALQYAEKKYGHGNARLGNFLSNLGRLYQSMGKFEKALPLLIEAVRVVETDLGKDHSWYGTHQNNLGALYIEMRDARKASDSYREALVNAAKNYGEAHPRYSSRCVGLANAYRDLKEYEKALKLLDIALRNTARGLGKEHRSYGDNLAHLAVLYYHMKKYDEALPHFREVLKIYEKSLGMDHPWYGQILLNMGRCHRALEEFDAAEQYFLAALQNVSKSVGKEHIWYGMALDNLSSLYLAKNDHEKALPLFIELNDNLNFQIKQRFITMNERAQYAFMKDNHTAFARVSSFMFEQHDHPEMAGIAYDNQLLRKGLLQSNQAGLLNTIRTHPDHHIAGQFKQWEDIQQWLSRQYLKPEKDRSSRFDSLWTVAQNLEVALANESTPFREDRTWVGWKDIQQKLLPGEATIEFSHFHYYHNGRPTDSIRYVAHVLRKDFLKPQTVFLFEEREIKARIAGLRDEQIPSATGLYSSRGVVRRNRKTQRPLYEVTWHPMDSFLTGVHTIYFAPTGLLHRINFGAIPIENDSLLSDRYDLHQLGNTRRLFFREGEKTFLSKEALLLGAARFEGDTLPIPLHPQEWSTPSENSDLLASQGIEFYLRGGVDSWPYLPGTAQEIDQIGQILTEAGYEVKTHKGPDAREERIREAAKEQASPRILHLATHGYFFSDPELEDTRADDHVPDVKRAEHPMIRSGLILAGANHAWQGHPPFPGREDGILTAHEIAQVNLSSTELVVLSACETGLGDIEGHEGVYGLQRAFKIAGVKYVIMSLWQVPDQQSAELMIHFYSNWVKKKIPIRKAFSAAQKVMRDKYEDPYYWAGFVLIE